MAIKFKVGTTFGGKDETSKIFRRMGRSADKFGRQSSNAFRRASRSATSFKTITKGILGAQLITSGIARLQQGVSSITQDFIKFDDAIVGAAVRFKDIGPDAKNFNERLDLIKKSARTAGQTTEFTAAQAAESLNFMAKAGFTSTEAMGGLRSMIDLATATGEDFNRVADISSDLLGAFGLNADDPIKKIANLNRLNDVLVKTANSANVTVEDLFDTMKTIGPIATGILGASLEEVSALTAVMGNSGIKGTLAMTALKNAYLNLAAPVGEGAKLLKRLNITLDDGEGGARKMTDVMAEIGEKIKGFGRVKQAGIMDAIFGKRAIAGSKNLIDNITNIKKFEGSLENISGASKRSAEVMRTSLGNRLKGLQSALTEMGFKFIDTFSVKGKDLITEFTTAVRNFDITPVKNFFNFMKKIVDKTGLIELMKDGFRDAGPVMSLALKGSVVLLESMAQAVSDIVTGLRFILRIKTPEQIKQAEIEAAKDTPRNRLFRDVGNVFDRIVGSKLLQPAFQTQEEAEESRRRGEQEREKFRGLRSITPPNQAAANNLNVGVGVETTINAPEGTTSETKVSRKKIDRSALGANNVLQGAF